MRDSQATYVAGAKSAENKRHFVTVLVNSRDLDLDMRQKEKKGAEVSQ